MELQIKVSRGMRDRLGHSWVLVYIEHRGGGPLCASEKKSRGVILMIDQQTNKQTVSDFRGPVTHQLQALLETLQLVLLALGEGLGVLARGQAGDVGGGLLDVAEANDSGQSGSGQGSGHLLLGGGLAHDLGGNRGAAGQGRPSVQLLGNQVGEPEARIAR